jgi:hypothetical protein
VSLIVSFQGDCSRPGSLAEPIKGLLGSRSHAEIAELLLAKCAASALPRRRLKQVWVEYPGREVTLRQRTRVLDGTAVRARGRS